MPETNTSFVLIPLLCSFSYQADDVLVSINSTPLVSPYNCFILFHLLLIKIPLFHEQTQITVYFKLSVFLYLYFLVLSWHPSLRLRLFIH